jgi:hypothetical protein
VLPRGGVQALALVRTAAFVIAVLLLAGAASGASRPASRIVDRTVSCRPYGVGYPDVSRTLVASASPGAGAAQGAYASFVNGPVQTPRGVAAVVALAGTEQGQVTLSRVTCRATTARIAPSSRKLKAYDTLRGGLVVKYRCELPARILVRVRAVFPKPVTLSPAPDAPYLLVARGRIREASVAVTSVNKVPIAFATVDERTRGASIFLAPSRCTHPK